MKHFNGTMAVGYLRRCRRRSIRVLLVEDDDASHSPDLRELAQSSTGRRWCDAATLDRAIAHLDGDASTPCCSTSDLPDSRGVADASTARWPRSPRHADRGRSPRPKTSDRRVAAVQHGAQDYLPKSETDGRLLVARRCAMRIERAGLRRSSLRNASAQFRALIENALRHRRLVDDRRHDPLRQPVDRARHSAITRRNGSAQRGRVRAPGRPCTRVAEAVPRRGLATHQTMIRSCS